jgi:hexosaminidase
MTIPQLTYHQVFQRVAASVCIATAIVSCSPMPSDEAVNAFEGLIPKPSSATRGEGVFHIVQGTEIVAANPELNNLSLQLTRAVGDRTSIDIGKGEENKITLSIVSDENLGTEGYRIKINEKEIIIEGAQPAGVFYGIQTLRQLLAETKKRSGQWQIAVGTIEDGPNYEWRGAMLDVARHFFGVEDVKRYIDHISFYKMNRLHLHLSDDQGWRIEIKSWPQLTATGGKTQVGGNGGGFYTQEQYKDIVAYAADRFVMIIPEIDMPGHTNAALASYAELNCNNKATQLYEGIEVGFSTLCLKKDKVTFGFVTDVLRELAEMTPGPYLHIGGDEAHTTPKEDYLKFVSRFKEIVKAQGKSMIGWEEVGQSTVGPGDIAQFWHSPEHAAAAAGKGAKVLLSPSKRVYLDMKYDSTTKLGLNWAAYIEVDDAYNWDPAALVPGVAREQIIGVEAPVWTETLTNMDEVEYLVFPRLPGIAEIGWSKGERNWDEYRKRLGRHGETMTGMGINFYKSPKVDWGGAANP